MNRTPVPDWSGDFVGRLHTHRVSQQEIADAMGVSRQYVTMILNGWKEPVGAEHMLENALQKVLDLRNQSDGQQKEDRN